MNPAGVDRGSVLVAVVDEDPWTVRSVNGVLRDVGFRTLGFSSPLAALEILVPRRFDVVITEHRMRELSGASLSAMARERLGVDRPGFVLLTRALYSVDDQERALFDACVGKPFKVIDLIAAIEGAAAARGHATAPAPVPSMTQPGARRLRAKAGSTAGGGGGEPA